MVGSAPEMGERRLGASAPAAIAASAVAAGGTSALVVTRHPVWAGLTTAIGAVALSWGSIRAWSPGRPVDPRARFAARIADPVFDTVILAAMAWAARNAAHRQAVLALVCLGASYLAAYERARARSLRYRAAEGAAYRGTRSLFLVIGLAFGVLEPALWALAGLTLAAVAARAANVARQERRVGRRAAPTLSEGGR
jgi:hypothetical protein